MDDRTLNTVRLETSALEMRALRASIEAWLVECADADVDFAGKYQGKYKSQLAALRGLLLGAAEAVEKAISALRDRLSEPAGEFHAAGRECDGAIVWLHRLWDSFREKYAQRAIDRGTRNLLLAADEALWSCYATPMRLAGNKNPRAPLAFVESEYSPAAIQAGRTMPAQLRLDSGDDDLRSFARSLPVSMLRLPPACLRSPWWLIFVAHEVGHYLQNDLGPWIKKDLDLIEHTRAGIKSAALACGVSESDSEWWGRWGEEIFADFISALLAGPWALWALCEVERGTPAEMCARQRNYPSPIVRLALMKSTLESLGRLDAKDPNDPWAMRGIDPAALASGFQQAQGDLHAVPYVVKFLMQPLPNGKTLASLCAAEPPPAAPWPRAKVAGWRDHMLGRKNVPTEQTADAARLVLCGSLAAWAEVVSTDGLDEKARVSFRSSIAEKCLAALAASSEPGLRAAGDAEDAETHARSRGEGMATSVLNRLRSKAVAAGATGGDH